MSDNGRITNMNDEELLESFKVCKVDGDCHGNKCPMYIYENCEKLLCAEVHKRYSGRLEEERMLCDDGK